MSVHTIEANLGIYTQPGKQPSYVAIGEFGVGSADPAATAANGAAQESQDRIFLEAETTDFKTPVDIYYEDVNPANGTTVNRWVTPAEMTGEAATTQWPQGGGITTANTGAQPQRDRLRATKAPIGLLSQPTRTVRVVARSLCVPNAPSLDANGNPNFAPTTVDNCLSHGGAVREPAGQRPDAGPVHRADVRVHLPRERPARRRPGPQRPVAPALHRQRRGQRHRPGVPEPLVSRQP